MKSKKLKEKFSDNCMMCSKCNIEMEWLKGIKGVGFDGNGCWRCTSCLNIVNENGEIPIVIDFDGTIVDHDMNVLEGAIYSINKLKEYGYKIKIYTCREDTENIENFLNENGIPFDDIYTNEDTVRKPTASYYIDDRAIQFTNWNDVMGKLLNSNHRVAYKPMSELFEDWYDYKEVKWPLQALKDLWQEIKHSAITSPVSDEKKPLFELSDVVREEILYRELYGKLNDNLSSKCIVLSNKIVIAKEDEEVLELIGRVQDTKDTVAFEELADKYKGLINQIIFRYYPYARYKLDIYDDLYSKALEIMFEVINEYDITKELKFDTYFYNPLVWQFSIKEHRDELSIFDKEIRSLEDEISEDVYLKDLFVVEERDMPSDMKDEIMDAIYKLSQEEREVIVEFFGIGGNEKGLKDIMTEKGYTLAQVRYIIRRAMEKLRPMLKSFAQKRIEIRLDAVDLNVYYRSGVIVYNSNEYHWSANLKEGEWIIEPEEIIMAFDDKDITKAEFNYIIEQIKDKLSEDKFKGLKHSLKEYIAMEEIEKKPGITRAELTDILMFNRKIHNVANDVNEDVKNLTDNGDVVALGERLYTNEWMETHKKDVEEMFSEKVIAILRKGQFDRSHTVTQNTYSDYNKDPSVTLGEDKDKIEKSGDFNRSKMWAFPVETEEKLKFQKPTENIKRDKVI